MSVLYRLQPALVFFVVVLVGLLTAAASWYTIDQANRMSFAAMADRSVQRLRDRIDNHMLLIKSTEALFAGLGEVPSAEQFRVFIGRLQKTEQFSGVQGIGFARYVRTGPQSDEAIAAELDRNYGILRAPWPETSEENRTPIVLLEPRTDRNVAALGYDMFSEPTRRKAIVAALIEQRMRASSALQLVQETAGDPQSGFLIYMPFFAVNSGRPLGFVYAPFRVTNLFESALKRIPVLPIHVTAWDGKPETSNLIYESLGDPGQRLGAAHTVMTTIDVAGQTWTLEIRPSEVYRSPVDQTRSFMLAIASLLLAAALATSSRSQQRNIEVGEALRQETERALTEREFLLQEMKHRIKNMIARVLAISRQTARSSESLPDFTQSFNARLQAMAASQDLLARTSWQGADLKTLLSQELKQIFGDELDEAHLNGPAIELNETAAQAFGLAFHELATNSLKYGSARYNSGILKVSWTLKRATGQPRELVLNWSERSEQPLEPQEAEVVGHKGGFGTRLLDATMRIELGGAISSAPHSYGIDVTITVPFDNVISRRKPPVSTKAQRKRRAE
ncbi:CHASE domain-containing protein [Hoeflea ulvae]|uniref:histidine kinase n=1 Tax=Hoeflea ulvae TaxID=2983764 RepID=A0ABT3YH95_9HYPH|nr:CHASE domain-containing protein [Hoeflea ulvae]MCY0095269.1 CHASE domain-containing protein [Hoeflea ulvae]